MQRVAITRALIASLCQRIIHIRDGKLMTGLLSES